jgi:hypothetical protein
MASAGWALQKAIHAALTADMGLVALLGGPSVFDDVPPRSAFPYVTLGQSTERDWSTATEDGAEHLVTLHVWSRKVGRKETREIMEAIRMALHDRPLAADGHRVANIRHEFSEARRDADGETYHGIMRYRAVTEPVA